MIPMSLRLVMTLAPGTGILLEMAFALSARRRQGGEGHRLLRTMSLINAYSIRIPSFTFVFVIL